MQGCIRVHSLTAPSQLWLEKLIKIISGFVQVSICGSCLSEIFFELEKTLLSSCANIICRHQSKATTLLLAPKHSPKRIIKSTRVWTKHIRGIFDAPYMYLTIVFGLLFYVKNDWCDLLFKNFTGSICFDVYVYTVLSPYHHNPSSTVWGHLNRAG